MLSRAASAQDNYSHVDWSPALSLVALLASLSRYLSLPSTHYSTMSQLCAALVLSEVKAQDYRLSKSRRQDNKTSDLFMTMARIARSSPTEAEAARSIEQYVDMLSKDEQKDFFHSWLLIRSSRAQLGGVPAHLASEQVLCCQMGTKSFTDAFTEIDRLHAANN